MERQKELSMTIYILLKYSFLIFHKSAGEKIGQATSEMDTHYQHDKDSPYKMFQNGWHRNRKCLAATRHFLVQRIMIYPFFSLLSVSMSLNV